MQWFSDLLAIAMSMFIIRSCTAITPTPQNRETPSIQSMQTSDTNTNQVWDDVEEKIENKWGSAHPNIKKAATQLAIAVQHSLNPKVDIDVRSKELSEAIACMIATEREHNKNIEITTLSQEVRDLVISNSVRQKQYIKYNAELSGIMLPVPGSSLFYCKYNNRK
jgi:hypothetical protein